MDKISTGFAGVLFMLAANADAQTRQSSVERRRVFRVSADQGVVLRILPTDPGPVQRSAAIFPAPLG